MLDKGTRLGKFLIIDKLGKGGMADVYLAEDTTLHRQVALKILPPQFARDEALVSRFEKEVLHCASLQHPGIVTIFEVAHEAGHHFYTMSLLKGGDLKRTILQGLKPVQALKYIRQIAEALDYAHVKGFVHRDLKPENIIFDGHGRPVITDFGIAKVVGSGTKMTVTGMSIGTPHYMSPEQAQGRADLDGRSDLYSLGIILHEMLTGQVPFDAENTVGIAMQHVQAPLPKLPSNLGKLQPLLDRLLAKDPGQRYQNAGDLILAIDQVLSGQTLPKTVKPKQRPAPKTQIIQSPSSKKTKGSGLKWAIGGALLAVLVVGGVMLTQSMTKPRPVLSGGGGTGMPPSGQTQPTLSSTKPATVQTPLAKGSAILQVNSDPAGADVFLDKQKLGITPLTRDDLPAGSHELRLKLKYHANHTEPVRLVDAEVIKKRVMLERGRGKVTVLSEPSGSIVYLDGKVQKEKTPLTINEVPSGPHTVKVHKDTYYDVEESVELLPDRTAKLSVTLNGGHLVNYKGEWLEPDVAEERRLKAEKKAAEERRLAEKVAKRKKFSSYLADAARHVKQGDRDKAVAAYESALHLFPEDAEAKAGLSKAKKLLPKYYTDSETGMEFVLVKGGCYQMGSYDGDPDEKPVHEVCLDGFYLGKFEVTQSQYRKIVKSNPSEFNGSDHPVERVSWHDAQSFISKLNGRNNKGFRLPTEAEWEYAARSGGNNEKYAGTNSDSALSNYVWYGGNSGRRTHPVGQKRPNSLGLYDMSGNVWEWCSDYYEINFYNISPRNNPQGPVSGSERVNRGGSWRYWPENTRVANRNGNRPVDFESNLGFRVAFSAGF